MRRKKPEDQQLQTLKRIFVVTAIGGVLLTPCYSNEFLDAAKLPDKNNDRPVASLMAKNEIPSPLTQYTMS